MTARFEKFTEHARKVFEFAQEEAQHFNHNYIGTEHLLLGLVHEGDGTAARVLADLGVQLPKVREAVIFIIGRGDGLVVGDPGLTPRAKKVIALASDEARRLQSNSVGTEHLLLRLVREGEGVAAGVLLSLGVSLEKVRQQVLQVLQPAPQKALETDIYRFTLPTDTMGKLIRLSHDLNRSLDDLILEAITKTWLRDATDESEQATEA